MRLAKFIEKLDNGEITDLKPYHLSKTDLKKGFHHDDIIMNICTIVFTIMLIIGANTQR